MCKHSPQCPTSASTTHNAAVVVADHTDQGWVLRCNGVVSFIDGLDLGPAGTLLPLPEYAYAYAMAA